MEDLVQRVLELDEVERVMKWLGSQLDILVFLLAAITENDSRTKGKIYVDDVIVDTSPKVHTERIGFSATAPDEQTPMSITIADFQPSRYSRCIIFLI